MNMQPVESAAAAMEAASSLSDGEIAERVVSGDRACFELLMRRHNQRIYRVVRSVLRDERDVEDVMQQAYVNAFMHLRQFEQRSKFSTWMTRIALNEAFARRKKGQAAAGDGAVHEARSGELMNSIASPAPDPERQAYAGELTRALEQAVDALPEMYRTVFMLRDIGGLSTTETGEGLGIGDEAVKTRLHRARAMVRSAVTARLGEQLPAAFQFQAPRCDRVVASVLAQICAI
jgi:RNA polymerase sigma-70 factor (ECF subfamily)